MMEQLTAEEKKIVLKALEFLLDNLNTGKNSLIESATEEQVDDWMVVTGITKSALKKWKSLTGTKVKNDITKTNTL